MTEPYLGIVLKLGRGGDHLRAIREAVEEFLNSDAVGIVNDFESVPNHLVVKAFKNEDPPPLCSVVIGEYLYHARSVLDHLICELTEQNGESITSSTEFPIFDNPDKFYDGSGKLSKDILKRIDGLPDDKRQIVEEEQPFKRYAGHPEDDPLCKLYHLWNIDHHRALHLTSAFTDRGYIELSPPEAKKRLVPVGPAKYGPITGGESEIARFAIMQGPEVDLEVTTNVHFDVMFSESKVVGGKPVLYTLADIGVRVGEVVARLTGVTLPK